MTNLLDYDPGVNFVSPEISESCSSIYVDWEDYYEIFKENDKLKLLDLKNNHIPINFKKLVRYINTEGTVNPKGPIIDTPKKILLDLKPHQKRTLYEMISKENGKYRYSSGFNVNLLCDNVGSGKSLCILSLIAQKPIAQLKTDLYYSSKISYNSTSQPQGYYYYGSRYEIGRTLDISPSAISLESNLIIVPHNIFLQWKNYITKYTNIKTFFISNKKTYTKFCSSKKDIIKYSKENDIILIKSTMYKKFHQMINSVLLGENYSHSDLIVDVENESMNENLSIKLKHEMQKTKTEFLLSYKDFMNMTLYNKNHEFRTSIKNNFKKIEERLHKLINDYNWDDIGKHYDQKITPSKYKITGYYFERVIVDEVDSIKIPAFPYIYSKQTWYISSSINNIIYPYGDRQWIQQTGTYKTISSGIRGTGFLKEILVTMFRNTGWSSGSTKLDTYRGLFAIIRNNNKFIEKSIHIPEPIINMVHCHTPAHLYAIKNAIDKNALKAFNAGDTKKAIEILGCKGGSEKDLINQITQKLIDKKKLLEIKISERTTLLSTDIEKKENIKKLIEGSDSTPESLSLFDSVLMLTTKNIKNHKAVIKNSKEQIVSIDSKVKGIQDRLGDVKSKICPICCCGFNEPSVTPCCNNIFCIECITIALSTSKECPLCRAKIHIKDVNLIINNTEDTEVEALRDNKLKSKLENLIEIVVSSDSSKRFMIFSEYQETLKNIRQELDLLSINYSEIKGAGGTIQNIIHKFKNGEFKILLLNAKYFGAGLNLQFTDEIIIYHRMSKDLESQVIGRAQRLGRTDPLKINYLCYDNEYS